MRLHNESLIRVVYLARLIGVMAIVGGTFLASMVIVSAIRHPMESLPWMRLAMGVCGGVMAGIAMLMLASLLDRGRPWAFYAISGCAAAGALLGATAILFTMSLLPVAVVLPMLGLMAACGVAWPEVPAIRTPKPYAALTPIASLKVVIPPPPARGNGLHQHPPQQPPRPATDPADALVIEIRR